MYIKKLFYKLTNKDRHFHYKMNLKKAASVKKKCRNIQSRIGAKNYKYTENN